MDEVKSLGLPIGTDAEKAQNLRVSGRERGEPVGVEDGLVRDQFGDFFRIAEEIRRPQAAVWTDCWDLYNGVYDWSGKEDWQSRIVIPKVRGVVDKATASFRRALIRMKRFYHIESETKLGVEKGFFTMNLLDYWLEQLNFIEEFSTGLKAGLITSTIAFKIFPDWVEDRRPRLEPRTVTEKLIGPNGEDFGETLRQVMELVEGATNRWRLGFKAVDPFNLWIGPRNGYRIERVTRELSELDNLAAKGIYDREAVEELHTLTTMNVERYAEARRKNESPQQFQSRFSRPIELYHFWGDLYNNDGKLIERNVTYTMAGAVGGGGDGKTGTPTIVLRKPIINPLMTGKDPYVVGTPYIVPFSTYNRGIVTDIAPIVRMMTELSNLIIDGAQFDAMQAYEIDEDLLSNPRQAKRGVYPGAAFITKGFENPGQKNVVRSITTGKVPQLALNVLNYLDREQQLATSVTNALRGGDTGSNTLGEFQSLTAQANDSLDDAARTVEETVLDEMLEKMAGTVYQYHEDYSLERLQENFPRTANQLATMDPAERFATMMGGFDFRARGVSVFLDKGQDLQKIQSFVQLVSNIPGVMSRINVDELLEHIIIGIGWNPNKILISQGTPGAYPAAIQAGQPVAGPGDPATLTPAQLQSARQGAQLGGSRGNPQANAGMPLGTPGQRSAR